MSLTSQAIAERDDYLGSIELVATVGSTYRKIDYWTRIGLLRPVLDANGTGTQRVWSADETRAATVLEWCSTHGIQVTSELAARIVRAARSREPYAEFGPVCVDMSALLPT